MRVALLAGGFAPFWAAALPFLDSLHIFYQTFCRSSVEGLAHKRRLKMLFVVVIEPSLSVMHLVHCLVVAHRQLKFIAAPQ